MSTPIIDARGLRKTYSVRGRGKDAPRTVEAVKGVDITVAAGEIVGFLGPNGAGKTTTLRMLTTLLDPSGGTATVNGHDLAKDPVGVRRSIGYVAQMGTTDPSAVAGEELVDQARLYGIDRGVAAERGKALLSGLDLDGIWERKCGTLSGGQRRRLDIAMGLIHEPTIVFLDEPSTGLDPQSRANLWEHIRRVRDDFDTTVFITTHYMDEADALSDRLLVIDHGEIVGAGTSDELKRSVGGDQVLLTASSADAAAALAAAATEVLGDVPHEIDGDVVRLTVPDGASALPTLLREMGSGHDVAGVEVRRPTLDDVFLTMTGRSLRDEEA
ncbi:ATP-binding cassette domain-containing protein [Demequina activiva]|uniref:ABC transporter n=1 Tax=Demequina activiva TaxID=1582364 RepID=A0A919Q2S5_9MICO|nr:ATP-binding cassette domain-containing protein [Demequina activiva]GIG54197.1 ABC transporter [Demequina activiva]